MGVSKKQHQVDIGIETEGKKWVIAGIAVRAPMKPIKTKAKERQQYCDDESDESSSTTPTAKESKIPERLPCPPAPRKRRPSSTTCHFNGTREFFIPPDLESVFIRHVERAN